MSFRDDGEAMMARLDALEQSRSSHERELATRDEALELSRARITELEKEVSQLRRELSDRAATIRDLQRGRGVSVREPSEPEPDIPRDKDPETAAERYLAEGIARYQAGDRDGAHAKFRAGLARVPDHGELLRALRRYN
ncbi:MAG TPA: hypothetical protein VIU61_07220 [Kofleriaceae bacterium]